MNINQHLKSVASKCQIDLYERSSINRSAYTLKSHVDRYFGDEITNQYIFGSFSRDTILPRKVYEDSDVDYIIIFEDQGLEPQTYLDKIRRFAEKSYSRSEIKQSHPTIKLSLSHIRFELVPAVISQQGQVKIPAKNSDYRRWIITKPFALKNMLCIQELFHSGTLKPLIRIVKYWNVLNGKIFDSYEIEEKIINFRFYRYPSFNNLDLTKYFLEFMLSLSVSWTAPDWKKKKLELMKNKIQRLEIFDLLPVPKIKQFSCNFLDSLGYFS